MITTESPSVAPHCALVSAEQLAAGLHPVHPKMDAHFSWSFWKEAASYAAAAACVEELTAITMVTSGTKKVNFAALRTSTVSASTLRATKEGRAPTSVSGGRMITWGSTT